MVNIDRNCPKASCFMYQVSLYVPCWSLLYNFQSLIIFRYIYH